MNKDLEATLAELGPGYRELVARMKASYGLREDAPRVRRASFPRAAYLAAASLALAFGAAAFFAIAPRTAPSACLPANIYTAAYGGPANVRELLETQRADGSWQNDFITRQNAAALRGVADASVAYRKAVRYLRSRGLSPLTDAELHERSLAAARGNS